jgi:CheY-like chemotaxis protein
MHKLLLADDSVTIQRVIELTFSGEDVQVLAVNDGEQAIARIPLERPDVVLADIGMPRKGGYDVAAFVKSRPDLAHIPVLLLAGAFEPVDQARAEQVGADGVLIKPFEPRQVIERVKELLAVVAHAVAEPAPQPPAPIAEADTQSLDELFESLNQALAEPVRIDPVQTEPARVEPAPVAASTAASEPEPALAVQIEPEPAPEAEFEPLVLEPPAPFESLAAPMTNGTTTLDDYFDRLSAAFEQSAPPASRPVPTIPDRLEDLSPLPEPRPAAPERGDEWPAQEWLSPAGAAIAFDRRGGEANPILEAVTALMSYGNEPAPQQTAPPAWAEPPSPAPIKPAPSQAMVDAVAERVLARLVPEVAESLRRLVEQEIARSRDAH